MTFETWRYEPLDPLRFPIGEGPFRVWGQAFVTAMSYVDRRLPGGRKSFLAALGPKDPFLPYYDQRFASDGDYDVSPLIRLLRAASELAHAPVGRFIEARSRWSATTDAKRVWKPEDGKGSAERVAERMHLAFNHYFRPTCARAVDVTAGRFAGELSKVPSSMNGLYVNATVGFVSAALELTGAKDIEFDWQRPALEGDLDGIPLERVRFVATWRSRREDGPAQRPMGTEMSDPDRRRE